MNSIPVNTIKERVTNLNDIALKNAEVSALKSFKTIECIQERTEKIIKKGLSLSAKNQDRLFTFLEKSKEKFQK